MSAKFSASRKRAFLTYLSQTGNQTISAERAKVSRSWVCLHRSTDAEFDAACRAAIAEAAERLAAGDECPRHSPFPRYLGGAELVVAGSNRRHKQVRRARIKQWTARTEKRFLEALAATCNVKAACAEAGLWPPSAYAHRKRWPGFAELWDEAEKIGYARIEAALVEEAGNLFSPREFEPDIPIEGMTVWHALQLLHMHRRQVRGTGGRPGLPAVKSQTATTAEVIKALERRLRSFETWQERQPGEREVRRFRRRCAKRGS